MGSFGDSTGLKRGSMYRFEKRANVTPHGPRTHIYRESLLALGPTLHEEFNTSQLIVTDLMKINNQNIQFH